MRTDYNTNPLDVWIVGDAHHDRYCFDWQFAIAARRDFPDIRIKYIPIEMLSLALRTFKKQDCD